MVSILVVVGVLAGALTIAALLIWLERRLLALWQDRYGPNRVGPLGVMQVLADVIKIFSKEDWIPPFADKPVFILAPAILIVSVLMSFAVVPVAPGIGVVDLNVGLLFFLAMSSMGVYSLVLAGWASASNYSLLGGLRAAAQMLSYEVFMGLSLMGVVLMAGSFNLREIVEAQRGLWFFIPQILGLIIFLFAGLAETHRLPFDLPEAENELISGFMTEYGGIKFALYFIAEYTAMVVNSAIVTTVFLGGWKWPAVISDLHPLAGVALFLAKVLLVLFLYVWVRASTPRVRFDKFMRFAWKFMLPLALANLLATAVVVALL